MFLCQMSKAAKLIAIGAGRRYQEGLILSPLATPCLIAHLGVPQSLPGEQLCPELGKDNGQGELILAEAKFQGQGAEHSDLG